MGDYRAQLLPIVTGSGQSMQCKATPKCHPDTPEDVQLGIQDLTICRLFQIGNIATIEQLVNPTLHRLFLKGSLSADMLSNWYKERIAQVQKFTDAHMYDVNSCNHMCKEVSVYTCLHTWPLYSENTGTNIFFRKQNGLRGFHTSFCSRYVWIWLLRGVPKVGSFIGSMTSSLLLASTWLFNPVTEKQGSDLMIVIGGCRTT